MRFFAVLILLVLQGAQASSGDSSEYFQHCQHRCLAAANCSSSFPFLHNPLTSFTCHQQCNYDCMWQQEAAILKTLPPHPPQQQQYFGKWPFVRVGGIQEPASVLFSLLNAYAHASPHLTAESRRSVIPASLPWLFALVCKANAVFAVNAWLCSAIFHWRDTWLTERMDYHSAVAHMCMQLWLAVCRIWMLHPHANAISLTVGVLIAVWFASHVWYLNMVHFDYGYNVMATLVVVAMQSSTWMYWAWHSRHKQPRASRLAVQFQLLLVACGLFELFDFPPVWSVLDAHACWHLCTIPLIWFWYAARAEDVKHFVEDKKKTDNDNDDGV